MPSSKVKIIFIPVSCSFRGSIQPALKLVSHNTEGVQGISPWHKKYFELKHLRIDFFFFFPEPSYFPKSRAFQKSSILINLLPWSFPTGEDWFLPTGRETSTPHVNRHRHKALRLFIYYLKGPSPIFPKSHLFSHKVLAFPPFHIE